MGYGELELRGLRPEDEPSFLKAVAACKNEIPPFEFAFDFNGTGPFEAYVRKVQAWSRGRGLPEAFVPNSFFVGVVDGDIVGRLSLRHCLNSFLETVGGHIGYGVVPARRRQGYATQMLRQALPVCASLGIQKVLLTCDTDNPGSRRVIEKCNGVFEGLTSDPRLKVQKRRYWIEIRDLRG